MLLRWWLLETFEMLDKQIKVKLFDQYVWLKQVILIKHINTN